MVKNWDGPTEESIAAETQGYALRAKLRRIDALQWRGGELDWHPNVDVFDNYRTALEISIFDGDKGRQELESIAGVLQSLRLISGPEAVSIERYNNSTAWRLSLPVKSIDQVELDRQAPSDAVRAAPKAAPLKLKL